MATAEPGADRHIWETRLAALDEELTSEPVEGLAELLDLAEEVAAAAGIDDRAGDGDAFEIQTSLDRARELVVAADEGLDVRRDDAQQAAADLRGIVEATLRGALVGGRTDTQDDG